MARALWRIALVVAAACLFAPSVDAANKKEIDLKVDAALARFYEEVNGARDFTKAAKAMLVFPNVIKAGFGIGGEYGTGALRVGGQSVAYYSTTAASVGFQIGAQAKTVLLCFLTEKALVDFRKSNGWEIGIDGSVALIDIGAGGSIDTTTARTPIVGFVFGQSGLMANVSLEGAKISKIHPD